MTTHELKCVPPYFQDVVDGTKPFEVRLNDRHFQIGDKIILREFLTGEYVGFTGRICEVNITYILNLSEFLNIMSCPINSKANWVVLGIELDEFDVDGMTG